MMLIAILSDQSLLTQWIISRLHNSAPARNIQMVEISQSDTVEKLILLEPDVVIFESKDFSSPGHLLQVVSNLAGKKLKAHFHKKQTEVWYFLEGNATWTINGVAYTVKPGDAFVIEPNDVHEVNNTNTTDCKVLVFKINLPKDDPDFYTVS